jgi:hypothetical protein
MTYFTFQDEPRHTTATPPDAPVITYDIGTDGSVLIVSCVLADPSMGPLGGLTTALPPG